MARRKKNHSFFRRIRKKDDKNQPSILQNEEKKRWDWRTIMLGFVIVYCSVSFMNGCFSIVQLKAQQNEVVSQTREAQSEQQRLQQQADYLETNEAVEKSAREDLQMVKPGEILLSRKENTTQDADASQSEDSSSQQADNSTDSTETAQ